MIHIIILFCFLASHWLGTDTDEVQCDNSYCVDEDIASKATQQSQKLPGQSLYELLNQTYGMIL